MISFLLSQALAFSLLGIVVSLFKDDDLSFALSFIVLAILIVVEGIKHHKNDNGNSGDLP
jgi:hypothetical protein